MGVAAEKRIAGFTYADYLSWDDDRRWEIIKGEAYDMSPAPPPATFHQFISTELLFQLRSQLKKQNCNIFHSPFDVRLPSGDEEEEDIENVVQPDISLVCDPGKLDKKGCLGPPDLIIEILSPASYRKDRLEKFHLYEQAGVKEYWLVSPEDKMVERFLLGAGGKYGRPDIYSESDSVRLKAVKGITIRLASIFNFELPPDQA
ncbi:MAG: Uma2 family endonuclease [bacterium]|nr:Uma2 family endonuclease [bacterium]